MQISRAARREGGVALRKDRRKTISLSSDRCTVALDTPLVEVGLHDNESLGGGATRRGTKEGKSALTIVRISVGDREANRLPRSIPRAFPQRTLTSREHVWSTESLWSALSIYSVTCYPVPSLS